MTRVILVGTKRVPTITTEELIQVEEVAFEKQTVENAELAKGTVNVLQKGKAGRRQDVYRLTLGWSCDQERINSLRNPRKTTSRDH